MCCCDAVDEEEVRLCCALCCINCSVYNNWDCIGTSGKCGVLCCNCECCFKCGAPPLFPLCCLGCKPVWNECAVVNGQCHACCLVCSTAIPCNSEVPLAVSIVGLTVYPMCGCCIKQKEIMER